MPIKKASKKTKKIEQPMSLSDPGATPSIKKTVIADSEKIKKNFILVEQFPPKEDAIGLASLEMLGYEVTKPNEDMGCTVKMEWQRRAHIKEVELGKVVYMTKYVLEEKEIVVQLHHQFKNGKTDMCLQKKINTDDKSQELKRLVEDARISHPLPNDAKWLVVEEGSSLFVKEAVNA